MTSAQETAVCVAALTDLFERDIAQLTRTKQPGHKAVRAKLKNAVREIRAKAKGASR